MRAFVFTDASLARHAGRFVWLSIDTENSKTAAFRKTFPVPALPSLFILDPRNEKVLIRRVGSANAGQLKTMLNAGEVAMRGVPGGADAVLGRADRLYGEGKNAEAARLYAEAMRKAPQGWKSYGHAAEARMFALASGDSLEECVQTARDTYPKLRGTAEGANVVSSGLDCALNLPPRNEYRKSFIDELKALTEEAMKDPNVILAPDDRSGIYIVLIREREVAADATGQKALTEEWSEFLDKTATAAKSADTRTVYDSHRLSAYIELGQPERAIPMLEQSERELAKDYNPPARLAVAYKAMKEYDKALASSDRALKQVYGPRKIGVLQTRSDIYKEKGDLQAARLTIEEAIAYAEALPEGQRSQKTIDNLKKKLAGLT
ncbi:MAG TPA: thiol reductase thioredoxin [Thermoanaerobaculia bacterium]|nr:thiol reductase thioredoxin [Thermoanaerobaculia bacterium]